MRKRISIIAPAYNEESNLPRLYERVTAIFAEKLPAYDYEVLILDNCSEDRTRETALALTAKDERWKYLRYSRNFGFDASITAGLDHAGGDAVVTLLSDLQDPPAYIPEMVKQWEAGAEIVNGVVRERNDGNWLKSLGAKLSYWLIYHLSETRITPGATEYRLLDRKVVEALRRLREPDRYLRGLVNWVGFRREFIPYDRAPRAEGESSAGLIFCIRYALNAIICFSAKPLQLATYFGLTITVGSLLLALAYLGIYFLRPDFATLPPPGISTLVLLILFGIGMQSFFLGLIGTYLSRVYDQGKNRMLYIVAERHGFDATGADPAEADG
ncbi:MAG: glycosyltransferase [Verrucomicrobia bacterium]|jgi:dolichol-phosphate mannosyltransferase|nr:glycosyltransferase [Verrucomicrobiota bacterium]